MKTHTSANCAMPNGMETEIPTALMVDPPYQCLTLEDFTSYIGQCKEIEMKYEKLLHE